MGSLLELCCGFVNNTRDMAWNECYGGGFDSKNVTQSAEREFNATPLTKCHSLNPS